MSYDLVGDPNAFYLYAISILIIFTKEMSLQGGKCHIPEQIKLFEIHYFFLAHIPSLPSLKI